MYETLLILKNTEKFSPGQMCQLIENICVDGKSEIAQYGNSITVSSGNGEININFNNAEFVSKESKDLASRLKVECADSVARFEVYGTDPNGDLIHTFYEIIRHLKDTNKFVIFDQTEDKLVFQD